MTIRKATISDSPFIALVVVEALGDDIMESLSTYEFREFGNVADVCVDAVRLQPFFKLQIYPVSCKR